jgi:cytokinin dehydrogenase
VTTLAAAADDFGHLVHQTPNAVLLPASAHDVAAAVRRAAGQGRRFAAQGRRHSVFGRAQARDGIVADMGRLRTLHAVQRDRVVVDAGATWREVVAATLPHGRTPPVLTDYLDLSVGGTLAVGGVGSATSRLGVMSDHVLELEVATGRGERSSVRRTATRACSTRCARDWGRWESSPGRPSGSFRRRGWSGGSCCSTPTWRRCWRPAAAGPRAPVRGRAGGGAGHPNRWLDVPARPHNAVHRGPPDDAALLAGLSDDRPKAQPSTLPYLDHLNRFTVLERLLRSNGQWWFPHPWLTTFVGDASVESVVDSELADLPPADLGPLGQVVVSPILRESVRSPLLRLPADPVCYTFNLFRLPATDEAGEARRLVMANRAVYERVRDVAGTLYPVSAFPMSRDDWRRHFGAAFDRLSEAKHDHDPGHVLTPGYEVF